MFDQPPLKTELSAVFDTFETSLAHEPELAAALSEGLIGKNALIPGPFGAKKLVYADYVASGRALCRVEGFVAEKVLPFYANSHTEASFCGGYTTRLRQGARDYIAQKTGANTAEHATIFIGSGATGGLNRLVHLFGIRETLALGVPVHVLVGPYEHHSNLLPWRESGANVIEITEGAQGGPDPDDLARALAATPTDALVIAAFSAASNVTGILCDITALTRQVKKTGARMVWDYAGAGPYLPIQMTPERGAEIDAIVVSPHKFIGGPGASGILIVRRDAVTATVPGQPGGGTVAFVNSQVHDYLARLEEREEGGTPNIIGDIRAALVFAVKSALGQAFITAKNERLTERALDALSRAPNIHLLGGARHDRLPIFSFIVVGNGDKTFDYQSFARGLSDQFGIQTRGGCACAGPYVHRLLAIGEQQSNRLRHEILEGNEARKPGFVRFNLSVLMSDPEVDFILSSIIRLAQNF